MTVQELIDELESLRESFYGGSYVDVRRPRW
jgi:hypothetical protein